jgi:primary-amine oxidase
LTRRRFVALGAAVAAAADAATSRAAQARDIAPPPQRSASGLQTVPKVAMHPLDPLTAAEFAQIKAVVGTLPTLGPRPIFAWVQLNEPPKAEVLAFRSGEAFRRDALFVALSPENRTAYEIVVDLRAHRVLASTNLQNLQPFLAGIEFDRAAEIVEASHEVKAALAKRGYTLPGKIGDRFFIDTYAPGQDAATLRDGRTIRAVRVLFADKQGGRNDYGPYVEGLMVLVDVYGQSVLKIEDVPGPTLRVRVPEDIFDRAVLGPEVPVTDLTIEPASASAVTLDGNHVRWLNWDFRFSFNQREGLVLHQIAVDDAGTLRSICYRAAVSEMLVPYADPSREWVWREFFDAGEYGLGAVAVNVRPGKELPNNALTLDAVLPGAALETLVEPNRVFFYEREAGALFAHVQATDQRHIYARAKELVAGYVTNVGNYDYVFQWILRQDGSFGFEAELQGMILDKTVADMRCSVCEREAQAGPGTYETSGAQEFGTLVSPQMLGVTHQHWINLRMDFDVDGTANAVEEYNVKRLPQNPQTNPAGRAFAVTRTVFGKAREAVRMLDDASNRSWVVYNPSKRSQIGQFAGYEIAPLGNTFSSIPPSRFGEPTSFVQRHLWVTRYAPRELYAAGWYPNQHPHDYSDGLVTYAGDGSIYDRDVVVWYSLGFTHVTRPEDFPIMPGERIGVDFKPRGFFARSPALGYARLDQTKE